MHARTPVSRFQRLQLGAREEAFDRWLILVVDVLGFRPLEKQRRSVEDWMSRVLRVVRKIAYTTLIQLRRDVFEGDTPVQLRFVFCRWLQVGQQELTHPKLGFHMGSEVGISLFPTGYLVLLELLPKMMHGFHVTGKIV